MSRQFRSDDTDKWKGGFGTGVLGNGNISSNSDYGGANEGVAGTSGTFACTLAAAGSFANGMKVIIWQSRGSHNGWEINEIVSGGGSTSLTMKYALQNTYTDSGNNQAQMLQLLEYNTLEVNTSISWSAPAWNESKGGAIAVLCKTSFTCTGTINLDQDGHLGGNGAPNNTVQQGEGNTSAKGTDNGNANGNGGGGRQDSGGGGGGNGTAGARGKNGGSDSSFGGNTAGAAELTTIAFGGGGGGGSAGNGSGSGARGGGVAFIFARNITITGNMFSRGGNGSSGGSGRGGGGGAGGSFIFKGENIVLGSGLVVATGGSGGAGGEGVGGAGGNGRIHADYSKTISGTTNPTLSSRQDLSIKPFSSGGGNPLHFGGGATVG